ncbi:MAG: polysaccharide deacetylase family protein [Bacteroidales bacterium]|nr:polysaccharide deacetylase family protein [Bacteroidales bacterium]
MFTFRKLTILFFILLFALNVIHFLGCKLEWFSGHLCSQTYVYMVVLFGLYIGISITMAFFISSNYHHKAICKGVTTEKLCALTFDDGPDPENTPAILRILNRERIPATFFVIGAKLNGNESILREMDAEGHLVGNHSWSHSIWFDFLPARRIRRELTRTAKAVSEITGKSPLLFRPPYGVINPMLSNALRSLAYHVIGWNIRSYDTVHRDPEKTVTKILRKLSPGSIILLHDHLADSPKLLERVIDQLRLHGYQIVPITQLTHIEAYA